jgi:hypothetical protein
MIQDIFGQEMKTHTKLNGKYIYLLSSCSNFYCKEAKRWNLSGTLFEVLIVMLVTVHCDVTPCRWEGVLDVSKNRGDFNLKGQVAHEEGIFLGPLDLCR